MTDRPTPAPASKALLALRVACFGSVSLSFPVSAALVFGLGVDRHQVADGLAVIYGVGLVLGDAIAGSPDAPWAYAWWAYIDGGDARYAVGDPLLVAMETLSVCNGMVGALALTRYLRSGRTNLPARCVLGGTAVVHLYSASLYYASELLTGLPNVGDGFISVYIKFGLANSLWVVAPFFVFRFVYDGLVPAPHVVTQASA